MGFLTKGDFEPKDKKRGIPKTASKGIYNGKYRTQIVHLKIKNKAPFNLGIDGTGENIVGIRLLTKSGKVVSSSDAIINQKTFDTNWSYQLEYQKGKSKTKHKINITKVFKDKDFGGSTGASTGTSKKGPIKIDTAQQERVTALIFEQVLNKKTPKWKTFEQMYDASSSGLKKIHPNLKVENYKKDDWWKHFDLQFNNIDKLTDLKSNHFEVFNRDGDFMDFISKLVTKGTGGKLLPKEHGIFNAKDSWNPADIWLIDTAPSGPYTKLMADLKSATTIAKLNDILRIAFNKQIVVGISLKKSGGFGGKIFYEKVNLYKNASTQKLPLINIEQIEFDPYFDGNGFPSVTSAFTLKDNNGRIYKLIFRRNSPGVTDITYEFLEPGMKHQMGKVPKDRFASVLGKLGLTYPSKSHYSSFSSGSSASKLKWNSIKKNANKLLSEYKWTVGSQSSNRVDIKKPKQVSKEEWAVRVEQAEKETMKNTSVHWKNFVKNLEKSWEVGGLWPGNSTMMQMIDFLNVLQLVADKKKKKGFEQLLTDIFYYAQKKGQKWGFGPFSKLY